MVTPDEQRALELRNAEADERFWNSLHDLNANIVEGPVANKVTEGQAAMANAASHRDAAKDRRERLERGEGVPGGFGKPFTSEDVDPILREAGVDIEDARWNMKETRGCRASGVFQNPAKIGDRSKGESDDNAGSQDWNARRLGEPFRRSV
jgi:hypothetical protein